LCLKEISRPRKGGKVSDLKYGAAKSQKLEKNQWALTEFLASSLEAFSFDDAAAAQRRGALRHDLKKVGKPLGAMDMLIAVHTLSARTTLVTNNVNEFRQIQALPLENWA